MVVVLLVWMISGWWGSGGTDTYGPPPGIRVVEGKDGWRLGVPSSPAEAGDDVPIWYNGSNIERGNRVAIALGVDGPDGEFAAYWGANLGAPGWTYLPLEKTDESGEYTAFVLDPATQERLVEATFTVAQRD